MSATVLTADAARAAQLDLISNGRGTQALHEAVVAMRANRRSGTAQTKTKATVSGSGKKPYRQKGTGRARAGYLSSPIRVGGGVVFGPHPRDYSKRTPKAVRRLAFRKALSSRVLGGDVLVSDAPSFEVTELKTKAFLVRLQEEMTAQSFRNVLVVAETFDERTFKAARNVAHAQLVTANDVNSEQLLRYDKILVTRGALERMVARTNGQATDADAAPSAPAAHPDHDEPK